jgi:hypothetical protein
VRVVGGPSNRIELDKAFQGTAMLGDGPLPLWLEYKEASNCHSILIHFRQQVANHKNHIVPVSTQDSTTPSQPRTSCGIDTQAVHM